MRDTATAPLVDLGPFALPSVFWTPAYLGPSTGLEHLPFLFWLVQAARPEALVSVGDRSGAMYFALCQAVLQLALGTRCHAVLPGQEDQATHDLRAYHDARYGMFSTLCSDSASARERVPEGSVDVLHIECDGEPLRLQEELRKWAARLSARAVVIGSGIDQPSVPAALETISGTPRPHPYFQFTIGGGLLIMGAGPHPPELLRHLFQAGEREAAATAVRSMFASLGRSCASAFLQESVKGELAQLLGAAGLASPDHAASFERTVGAVARRQGDLHGLRDRDARIRRLELDGLLLKKERDDLQRAMQSLQRDIAGYEAAGQRASECEALLRGELEQVRCRSEEVAADLQARLQCELEAHAGTRAEADRLSNKLGRALDENTALVERARAEARKLATMSKELMACRGRLDRVEGRHAQLEAELARVLQSRSWRLTDPVRRGLHHLRRLVPWT